MSDVLSVSCDATVVERLAIALDRTGAVVEKVGGGLLTCPSACDRWTVALLIEHMTVVTDKFSSFARGDTDSPRQQAVGVEMMVRTRYRESADASGIAWARPTDREVCHLPFGSFDRWTAAAINAFDVMLHGWDLAQSIGVSYDVDEASAVLALSVAHLLATPEARRAGHYGPEQRVAAGMSTFDMTLSLTGRAAPGLPPTR